MCVFHVRPTAEHWEVIKEGFRRPHFIRPSKAEAIFLAKRLAKVGSPGQVIIHAADDEVEMRFNYCATSGPREEESPISETSETSVH
jgi:hypothetical protein